MAEQFDLHHVLIEMEHRLKLLDTLSLEIKSVEHKILYQSNEQKKIINSTLSSLNNELDEVAQTLNTLHKTIHQTGNQLGRCISQKKFEEVKNSSNKLQFHEFIQRKELKSTFDHFAHRQ